MLRALRIPISKASCWLALLVLPCSLTLQAQNRQEVSKSPREFVQEFYKWYVPKALSDNPTGAWNLALKYRNSAFSRELAELLREDSVAQAKCGELVGLDFDPFLNSQDPAESYEVAGIDQKGEHYRANIYSVQSSKRSEKPRVSADLLERDSHWVFVNFFYPDGGNLLAILKSPRPKCSAPRSSAKSLGVHFHDLAPSTLPCSPWISFLLLGQVRMSISAHGRRGHISSARRGFLRLDHSLCR
jgi:hypothetical protein